MRRWFLFLAIGTLLCAIVLVTFPARVALKLLPESALPVQMEGVGGTLWSGHANRVLRDGRALGQLQWRLRPLPLLRGRIDTDLILAGPELQGSGRIIAGGDGNLRVEGGKARFPAARLERLLDVPALTLAGSVEVSLAALELRNRVPVALQGEAVWNDAGVSGAEQAVFGTLRAEFAALPGGGFGGRVSDQGDGPLAVDGKFSTSLLGFEARATLRARDGNPQVQSALRHIGQMQPDGSVVYELRGGLMEKGA